MERAPFGWSQPVERDVESSPRVERPAPSGTPVLGQPYIWATPQPRPRVRYVDDTPKMGRAGTAAFLGFLLALAFGAVWVIEQDFRGPATQNPEAPTAANQSSPLPPAEAPATNIDDQSQSSPEQASRSMEVPPVADEANEPDVSDVDAGEPEGPPLRESKPSSAATRVPDTPRPTRAESRPAPTRSAPAPTPTPRIPFPTAPPLSQQIARTPPPESAPAPPRVAAAEPAPASSPAPLPRVAVEEPVFTPPVTPPPEPPPPPARAPDAAPVAAPAPTNAATRPAAADVDNSAIRDVLGRYRTAFNSLDAKAAHQVWPTVNERTLDRAFGQLEQQNVSFDRCTIAVKGVLAQANCNGTTRFVPRVGSRSEQVEARQWNFSLRKASSGGWVIQQVEAR